MIRRFLVWIGLIRAEDARSEAKTVLNEARLEIKASREARRRELALRLAVRDRR